MSCGRIVVCNETDDPFDVQVETFAAVYRVEPRGRLVIEAPGAPDYEYTDGGKLKWLQLNDSSEFFVEIDGKLVNGLTHPTNLDSL